MALFAALGFAACIMDDVDAPLDPVTAQKIAKLNGSTLYIRLFSDGELTRADSKDLEYDEDDHNTGDLVNGSEMEHRIDPKGGHFIIFFDKNEKFYSIADLAEVNLAERDDYDHVDGDGKDNHIREVIFGARVTPDEDKEELPAWCLVVLNGGGLLDAKEKTIMGDALTNKTISDVLEYSWKWEASDNSNLYTIGTDLTKKEAFGYGRNDNGYFVMTNAVYVHTEDGKSEVFTAVPIDTGDPNNADDTGMFQFGDFDPKKILFIHVERMLAKYDFGIKVDWEKYKGFVSGNNTEYFQPSTTPDVVLFEKFLEAGDPGVTAEDIGSPKYVAQKWMIQLTGWAINALERSSYLFKHLSDDLKYEDNYKGSPAWDMNGPNGWNDQKNYRSYWAEDLTYNDTRYPWQYRSPGYETEENVPSHRGEYTATDGVTRLKNYSYNELKFNAENDETAENDRLKANFARAIYAPESTYDAAAVRGDANNPTRHDGRDELLAASHLLVGARLLIDKGEGFEALDVFRDRNGFFYLSERDVFAVFCHSINQLLTSQQSMDFTYYRWSTPGTDEKMYKFQQYIDRNPYWQLVWEGPLDMENRDQLAAKPASFLHYYDDTPGGNPYNNNPFGRGQDPYNGNYEFGLYWINESGQYWLLDDEFFRTECPNQAAFKSLFGELTIGNIPSGDGQRLPWPEKGRLDIFNHADDRKENRNNHSADGLDRIYIFTRDHDQALRPTARKELRYASDNDIKSILYEWVGAIDHFNEGRMYYAHGIEQASSRVVMQGNTIVTDEEDRPLSLTGRFGAVRNNWYQLRLTRINSLGVPVDKPDQPIVPDRATPHDQINVSVSIQDWHHENTTTGTLPNTPQ